MPSPQELYTAIFAEAGLSPACTSSGVQRLPHGVYFTKHAKGKAIAQMRGEAASLRAMAMTAPPGLIPRVIGFKDVGGLGAMVSTYADRGGHRRDAQRKLGEAVAGMHSRPSSGHEDGEVDHAYTGKYGFGVPTHCGATEQDNTWEESWEAFFRDRRLGDIVRRLGDAKVTKTWDRMKERAVPLLLHKFDPPPVPVPLHGDLWSGNVAYTAEGPVIFDPAGYYGHCEADLGITHMFGGFTNEFYDAYHAVHPRSQPYYEQRQTLYELYHHLNHALMFGGGYRSAALRMMEELVSWADSIDAEDK